MKNPEAELQKAVVKYIRLQYPYARFNANASELRGGKQGARAGAKAKAMGASKGVPDLMIYEEWEEGFETEISGLSEQSYFCGLAIELKIHPNKPTKAQAEWLERLQSIGWRCEVVYDFDTAKRILDEYLG